jgi:hypothetical protein
MKIKSSMYDMKKSENYLYIELEDGEQIEQVKNDIIITTIDIDVIH